MRSLAQAWLFLIASTLAANEPIRTWTSADGRTLEARYLEVVGDKVRIENASGRKFTVPLTGFSPADQEYVKKAHVRSLFAEPQPFEEEGKGGVIVTSFKGKVEVITANRDRYSDPKPRPAIVGEPVGTGSTLVTGGGAEAVLLLTNGTLAHMGENTKLVLTALYQKAFKATMLNANELERETGPSRTSLSLDAGDLVLEVPKLSRASSFLVTTEVAQSGIRGTCFKVSTKAGFTELAVLEGRVDFLDGADEVSPVETARKAGAKTGESAEVVEMTEVEKAEIAKVLELSRVSSTTIDTSRLASTVDGYAPKRNYFVKSAKKMEMIWCPPGGFLMGPGPDEDSPAHPVLLTKGFYLGKYEVTQEQFEKVLRVNASTFRGDDLPVEMVSWNDAVKFCDTLNKMERPPRGWRFSLPTEAQWEYACRAGTTTAYSFGEFIAPESANYAASGIRRTKPVGSYPPNLFGFYDMCGNVDEWTADFYGPYPQTQRTDPKGPEGGASMVTRGGSWNAAENYLRSSSRFKYQAHIRGDYIGFRVAFSQID
jgi:formylglycine-generating enzyme required for sulfatase activity